MKRILYLSIFILTMTSCASMMSLAPSQGTKYTYEYSLVKPLESETPAYSDSIIDIAFSFSDKQIGFKLKNKSDLPIVLDWNNVSLVEFGEAKKVMHIGVKYTDRNSTQAPTTIPPLSAIEDMVLPTDNVYYRDGYYGTYHTSAGGWETHDLFPTHDLNKQETSDFILSLKGTEFSLYMPLVVNKEEVHYNFVFKISNVYANTPPETAQGVN